MKFLRDSNDELIYDSAEYHFDKMVESLNEGLEKLNKLKDLVNISSIMPVKIIKVLPISYFSSYFKGCSWTTFDPLNRNHIDNAYKNVNKEIEIKLKYIEETHKENLIALENNIKIKEHVINFMQMIGISKEYYKTIKNKSTRFDSGFIFDLNRLVIVDDDYKCVKSNLEGKVKELDNWLSSMIKDINKHLESQKNIDYNMRKLALAMQIAKDNDLSYSTNDELLTKVEDFKYNEFDKSLIKNKNDEDFDIKGNFMDGYYIEHYYNT